MIGVSVRRRLAPVGLIVGLAGCNPASCGAWLSPPDALRAQPERLQVRAAPPGELEVGAAVVDLTPTEPVWMAGFGFCKASRGVHDPITARALALRRGPLTALVIGCDLIGLHEYQVEAVRERLADVAPREAVLVAASHTHAGPDTLGMWGLLPPLFSGLEEEVIERVLAGIERAGREAVARLEPARARWGVALAPEEGVSKNSRDPQVIDRRVTAVAFDRPDGAPIATLVHFACHPETLGSKNRLLSADFPGPLREVVEAARPGSVCVFLNGALGGMVTTDERGHSFEEVARIGGALGALALDALAAGRPVEPASGAPALDLLCLRRVVWVPVQNRSYHLGHLFGIFGSRPFAAGYTRSEVSALALGSLVLLTAYGEVLPRLGLELQSLLGPAAPGLLVGLGGDELGYLLPERDWGEERYRYERTVSPGPLASTLLRSTAGEILASLAAARAAEAGR